MNTPEPLAASSTLDGDDANFKRSFALLQSQRDELRESFKFVFSEYSKWYTWIIGFNFTALGAATFIKDPQSWKYLATAFCVADLLSMGTCIFMMRMGAKIFEALADYRVRLMKLCESPHVSFPEFANEIPIREVAKWSLPSNAVGLALFALYWGYLAYASKGAA